MPRFIVTVDIEANSEETAFELVKITGLNPVSIEKYKSRRTLSQNNALHKWLALISLEAQNTGQTAGMLLKNPAELPITETMLKDCFKQISKKMYEIEHTSQLSTIQLQQVSIVFERIIAERLGISIPFPSIEK